MLVMGSGKFQRDTFEKKAKPENKPRESGYTLMTGPDEYFNENNQKQNNANIGNRPEWVGWSLE
jgi:hypothetical protein|tara:strand:- start:401 stop:592 length:192 start_codon:yes stop_codon:yes gene_type:complete